MRYGKVKGLSRKEIFQWIIVSIIFTVLFVLYLIYGFLSHCIFEWPIRWDVGTCWHEQINPARHKAAEEAANFAPQI